ncbi:MAG TPA: hypothetical protein VMI75_37290 [Polyangiaceae bacterium]|nr:hypothetical protein [Polyangiaceae bacterium]
MRHTPVEALLASVHDRERVFEFLCLFAGAEYALKRTNRLRRGHNDRAEADWRKFADESLRGRLATNGTDAVTRAFELLRRDGGPKEQYVTEEGGLGWRPVPERQGEFDEWRLVRLVRTVRNNLFHGGKYGSLGPIGDPTRDVSLLAACVTILKWCIEQDATLAKQLGIWLHEAA